MKSTLDLLKIGAPAYIVAIKNSNSTNRRQIERLYSVGVAPGRAISLLNKKNDLYVAQIASENPLCMREDLAELIEIHSNVNNLYQNKNERKKIESLLEKIKNIFGNFK